MSLKVFLRRFLNSHRAYFLLSRLRLVAMHLLGLTHEADFRFFRNLEPGGGVFVDIGANFGQAAVSFAGCTTGFKIISFEANPLLASELRFVGRLLKDRFEYRMTALGADRGEFKLHVPFAGKLPILPRASLDEATVLEFLAGEEAARYGKSNHVETVPVSVVPFDELAISPDIVKIDVEGAEAAVLEGMRETIRRCRPLFLIEYSGSFGDCARILKEFDYGFFCFREKTNRLAPLEQTPEAINFFALSGGWRARLEAGGLLEAVRHE